MNIRKNLVLITLLSTLLSAQEVSESGFYLGVGLGLLNSKSHTEVNLPAGHALPQNFDEDEKVQSFGINIGYRLTPNHRVHFEHHTFMRELAGKERELSVNLIGYSYTPNFSNSSWRALVGINVGSTSMVDDYNHNTSASTLSLKLGTIFELAQHHEIETGFRYEQVKFNISFLSGGMPQIKIAEGTQELKHRGFFAGYNYKF